MPALERAAILSELDPPFAVLGPARPSAPFVFCSPHSGRVYTKAFLARSRLDPLALRRSEDCYVDELFAHVAAQGVPLIAARFPRAYLDVNREPYELDPELFEGPLPDFANHRSVRVVGGLGTIARIVADGEEIYGSKLPLEIAFERIELLYKPFHAALAGLIEATRQRFGYAVLVDCHSMPSSGAGQPAGSRPDFVIGDRFGAACDQRLTRFLREQLAASGHDVQINRPYAGGFITEHYGRPTRGVHAVQIEINRGLYLNERTLEPTAAFASLGRQLAEMSSALFATLPAQLGYRTAAE